MADARLPWEFFEQVKPHLPPEQPVGPRGGRPRVPHYTVLKVIWHVLVTGCRWQDVPLVTGRLRTGQFGALQNRPEDDG